MIGNIELEINSLSKELDFNTEAEDKIKLLNDEKLKWLSELSQEEERYQNELKLSQLIINNRKKIDGSIDFNTAGAISELRELHDGKPLVNPWVDAQAVAEVVADWTGIPIGKMLQDDIENLLDLENSLNKYIFGQSSVITALSNSVRVARAGLQSPEKPVGIFLLAGPTGTGKTETALALADILYSGQHNLLSFNMTEFQESHTISVLKGAPPGYIGYGKGGLLTEAVRRRPYSVILLDEFDKAHRDVHDLFYQVFDKGWMEDGEGRQISFRQCLILMTTNVGAEEIIAACESNNESSFASLQGTARDALSRKFSPALLARINVLPYRPLEQTVLQSIATKHLNMLGERLLLENKIMLNLVGDVPGWIARKVDGSPNSGRAIYNLLSQSILPHLSYQILNANNSDVSISSVSLVLDDNDQLDLDFN
jgi:type VI secretion system protein VasG